MESAIDAAEACPLRCARPSADRHGTREDFHATDAQGVRQALDGARAGKTIEEVTKDARSALGKADVMDGVADLIPMVQIEAVFTDGSRLVTVHTPIQ